MGSQNSKDMKYWANDEPWFVTGLFYSTKILPKRNKGSVSQNLKNESDSDIYEQVLLPLFKQFITRFFL